MNNSVVSSIATEVHELDVPRSIAKSPVFELRIELALEQSAVLDDPIELIGKSRMVLQFVFENGRH